MTEPIDDAPLDEASMLALVRRQQAAVSRHLGASVPAILAAWGVAWLGGFMLMWLTAGTSPLITISPALRLAAFAMLITVASGISAVLGIRSGRGIRMTNGAAFTGIVYGLLWPVGHLALLGLALALVRAGMSRDLMAVFMPAASLMFNGIMFIVAAAVWRARMAAWLGVSLVIVGVAAPFFAAPTHLLIVAIGGGGLFLAAAAVSRWWAWQ